MKTRTLALVALAVCLPLAGCGNGKAPTGQVAAKVDGDEVTTKEVQAELNGFNAPDAKTRKLAEQQALQNIVTRKLLAKAAEKAGIAKSPDFAVQKQRMEDGLLVQAWQASLLKAVPAPAPEEVQQFITQHPEFYADHKVFALDQLRIPPISDPAILAELQKANALEGITQILDSHGIKSTPGKSTVDALTLPSQMLLQIEKMPPGEVFVIPSNGMMIANKIIETQVVPVPPEIATKHATQYIKAQRSREAVQRQFGAVVAQGKAKVQYNAAYAPPAAPPAKKTPPAASAGKAG